MRDHDSTPPERKEVPEAGAGTDGEAVGATPVSAPAAPDEPVSSPEPALDAPGAEDGSPAPEPSEPSEVERQRDEYLALAQRTQADFENYRKRSARDLRAAEARGVARLARELLPALDNLGRALAATDGDAGDEHLAAGVKLVQAELVAALGRVDIEPFSPRGERFDPQEHEAITQHPVEGAEPGTVADVYQQGYRHGDLVLRPARVVVAA